MSGEQSPVRLDATLAPQLSRGLWLVKWLLLIPHLVVLCFLWLAFVAMSVVAFFAILVTARYPRSLFEFNLGVMRWTWRVQYYSYAALGTDRYPPFTLAEVADYPAHLDIAYPERLSRGLVLVKWLLALPHYLVIAVFAGGGVWLSWRADDSDFNWAGGGLIGILVIVSGIVLLFTGRYPKPIFDFVLGMNRWIMRVAAYTGLMTDTYPPFRFDQGGTEPDSEPTVFAAPGSRPGPGWTTGRVLCVLAGAVLALTAAGPVTGGAALLWADRTQRDAGGFLTTADAGATGPGYALVTEEISLRGVDISNAPWSSVVGQARLTVTPDDPARPVFVGIAPAAAVDQFLAGAAVSTMRDLADGTVELSDRTGGPVATQPDQATIWAAQAEGSGQQVLTWRPTSGDWRVVVMNADSGQGVTVHVSVGAEAPGLIWIALGLIVLGAMMLAAGVVLIVVAVRRASHGPASPSTTEAAPVG